MMGERWVSILGYEGAYEASDKGRVRSLARREHVEEATRSYVRRRNAKLLRPYVDKDGYHRIVLYQDGRRVAHPVHRLVLWAFSGLAPAGTECGNHKNGVKSDNCPVNLEWVSNLDNHRHARRTGLLTPAIGSKHGIAKLTEEAVAHIKKELLSGSTLTRLAHKFGVVRATIRDIRDGVTWRHV